MLGSATASTLHDTNGSTAYTLAGDLQRRAGGDFWKPAQEGRSIDGDAAFGGAAVGLGAVPEDGASQGCGGGRVVVAKDEDDVIGVIVAPEGFG